MCPDPILVWSDGVVPGRESNPIFGILANVAPGASIDDLLDAAPIRGSSPGTVTARNLGTLAGASATYSNPVTTTDQPAHPDTGTLGTLTNRLSAYPQESGDYVPFHVRVYLHGFYVGSNYDGGLNGGTGEFYFSSIFTNATELFDTSSAGLGGTNGGFWSKVSSGAWIDTGSLLLWPDTSLLGPGRKPPTDMVKFALRLMESDSAVLALKVLGGLGKAGKEWVKAASGDNPAYMATYDAAIGLASDLLGVYGGNDVALDETIGLDGPLQHYRVGRFLKVRGNQGTYALISIVPQAVPDGSFWGAGEANVTDEGYVTVPLDTAVSGDQRLVAILVQPRTRWLGAVVRIENEIAEEDRSNRLFGVVQTAAQQRHYLLPPGSDPIRVHVASPGGAHIRVIATACRPTGATPFYGP